MMPSIALAAALRSCAPAAAPDTMAAIVAVESGGWPYALNDNTAHRSYRPPTRADALRIANAALRAGHSLDVGIAQVNSANFAAFNVDASRMLEPCANLRVGSTILANAYRVAAARYSAAPQALLHAIMAYNSGSIYAGDSYVRAVVAAATAPAPIVPSLTIVTSLRGSTLPVLPPAQIIAQPRSPRTARVNLPDPRQATLRVLGRGEDVRQAGIARTLDRQVDHRS